MLRFAATIFLSAFLLFLVQPLIGKYILPWFGGGSGVWTACLLFFQALLLGGYFYAHVLVSQFSPRWQTVIHVCVLLGALAFLPIIPNELWKPSPEDQPVARIVLLLGATLGLPYLALSATGPLLQAWFARTQPGRSPYRLYALSNAGSLLGLLGYPFLMEPLIGRAPQAYLWSGGFVVFTGLCAWCAIAAARQTATAREAAPQSVDQADPGLRSRSKSHRDRSAAAPPPDASSDPDPQSVTTPFDRVMWVLLPMCASIMLLAATSQLSEEVAPMPFVWVLPLATYLITFIIAFEWPRAYDRRAFGPLALAAPWLYLAVVMDTDAGLGAQMVLYLLMLFACCMVCHGEVYRLRPPPGEGGRRLTAYYLALSAGGALGGAFVSIVAPMIFNQNLEIYIGLFGSIALLLARLFRDPAAPFFRGANRPAWLGLIMVMLLSGIVIQRAVQSQQQFTELRMRNFYGSLRVRVFEVHAPRMTFARLEHGRITHGAQILDPVRRTLPVYYYTKSTGIGMVMERRPEDRGTRVAIVGLGTGTMAAWGREGDVFRFYEIDPQVELLAREVFTYLKDTSATVEVVMGDARLSMEREHPQNYDVIVLDAFSGDAVPMHLLTREAFETYRRHLAPDGVIAVHVTNRYLDLDRVVRRVAQEFDFGVATITADSLEIRPGVTSVWALLTHNEALLSDPEIVLAAAQSPHTWRGPPGRLWTDDYCSVFDALR